MRFRPGGGVECVRCVPDRGGRRGANPDLWQFLGHLAVGMLLALPKPRRRSGRNTWVPTVTNGGDSPVWNRIQRGR
jgi:hypothetical protein